MNTANPYETDDMVQYKEDRRKEFWENEREIERLQSKIRDLEERQGALIEEIDP